MSESKLSSNDVMTQSAETCGSASVEYRAPKVIGYARVSTNQQDLESQVAALKSAGATEIISEVVSGVKERPKLDRILSDLVCGDTLIVFHLDRLGRRALDIMMIVDDLNKRDVRLVVTYLGVDTQNPIGKTVVSIFSMMAELERDLVAERMAAGRAKAQAAGVRFGRKPKLSDVQIEHAKSLRLEGKSFRAIGELLGVGEATIRRAV